MILIFKWENVKLCAEVNLGLFYRDEDSDIASRNNSDNEDNKGEDVSNLKNN